MLIAALVLLIVGSFWSTGFLLHQRDDEQVIDVLQGALFRGPDGELTLRPTDGLRDLRARTPNLWFLIRDNNGKVMTEGSVPIQFLGIGDALREIGQAKLGWDPVSDNSHRAAAQMKRVDTSAGNVQIIATTEGKISVRKSVFESSMLYLSITLLSFILMGLATVIATPTVVRSALSGLREVAQSARGIDVDKRGTRLPTSRVPTEIIPLVSAINDALERLDQGHDRHRRFLANAAHELRTPIAILTIRLDSLPPGHQKTRLLEDIARLATLAEQLLDLQRLEHNTEVMTNVDLVSVAAQVTADLAPMAISAGYDISFINEAENVETWGDESSLQRAVINLVQNAIQHGGNAGAITVSVRIPATIEVCDEGPGIPSSLRDDVFEPFRRFHSSGRGAGLGLNLVREIVRLHLGELSIFDKHEHGACFRIVLPAMSHRT